MNIRHVAAIAAFLTIPAGLASAQGFSGAEISAEILAFTDDLDLGETEYRGAMEFDLFGGVGAAADLSYHGFRGLETDGRNLTLHGFYDGLGIATLGLFYGRDTVEDDGVDLYGFEAASSLYGAEVEGALGRYDGDDATGAILAGDIRYGFGSFAATGFAGALAGDIEASRLALGGEYQLGGAGPTFYAEVGHRSVEDEGEAYVSLGARLGIGPKQGTTFDSRSLWEVIPGN